MTYKLNVGDKLPEFRCKDEEGYEVSNDDVIGSPLVIYFYPKDDTPGCTAEACAFRDTLDQLEDTDTLVLGVSPDSVESHQNFIKKHNLNFTLLADTDKTMCKTFGVLNGDKVERTTFVFDPDGVLSWVERPVNVEGHAERVLKSYQCVCLSIMDPISATLLTKNSEKYLDEVLTSLQSFDEVVVYDNGSTDNTLHIARQYPNVTIHEGPFFGFGPTHNTASKLAKHDWIFSIDSDEVVTPELAEAIKSLDLEDNSVYAFPRDNYYNGKWIKWCGWYPDYQTRLYNKTKTHFTDAQVHEAVITDGMEVVEVEAPLIHYSYSSLNDFLDKMQSYSTLFAEQNKGKKSSSPWKAVSHSFFAFFKSYILKRGFMGGYEGFVISAYNGHTAFYKYLKLYEANLKGKKSTNGP